MRTRDAMSSEVVVVADTATLLEALRLLINTRAVVLPVISGTGELIGLLSEIDVIRHTQVSDEEARYFRLHVEPGAALPTRMARALADPVSAAMTRDVVTVDEDTFLHDVAGIMLEKHLKRLPVVRGRLVVGIIGRLDLMRVALSQTEQKAPPSKAAAPDDQALRREVFAALHRLGAYLGAGFDVVAHGSVVHLWGELLDEADYRACVTAAAAVPGVTDVAMHMQVMTSRRREAYLGR
jgi:CBS domain-containing protein